MVIGNLSNLGPLITAVSAINLNINSLTFSASNTNTAIKQARIAAVNDARAKLNQLLSLSGLKNKGVKQIVDLNQDNIVPFVGSVAKYTQSATPQGSSQNKVQVSASVKVTWGV